MTEPIDEQDPTSWLRDAFTLLEIVVRVAGMLVNRWMTRATELLTFRAFVPILAALLFFGAMFWAKGRDPFQRVWFTLKPLGYAKAECVAVLPKNSPTPKVHLFSVGGAGGPPAPLPDSSGPSGTETTFRVQEPAQVGGVIPIPPGESPGGTGRLPVPPMPNTSLTALEVKSGTGRRLPVVVYQHGAGGSLLTSGNELRQMAEMGLAAVGMEYNQTNEAASDAEFTTLLGWLQRQRWADTNRIAWVGFSLGAQRQLAFVLHHPDLQPQLLVRLSGGWVPDLESNSDESRAGARSPAPLNRERAPKVEERKTESVQRMAILVVHGANDEVFPLADAQRVAACLQTNGVPVELKVMPGASHGFEPDRLLLFRAIGEYCLTHLKGPEALENYRSILSWQARAKPLWLFWIPAFLWAAAWWYLRRTWPPGESPAGTGVGTTEELPAVRAVSPVLPTQEKPPALNVWEIALRWIAGLLAAAALADTVLHLVPPRLRTSERTLSIARKHLVQPKEMADFDFLSTNPVWRGRPLKILLEHVELANYNRELIDWKLDDSFYREFVLSPQIDPTLDGDLNWRRPLWESFYPRIRKEPDAESAAPIVARYLRERVTIWERNGTKAERAMPIARIWERQITDAHGFEAIYVAAMRSVGIPSRLDARHRAEFWTGSAWQAAPRPVFEAWN